VIATCISPEATGGTVGDGGDPGEAGAGPIGTIGGVIGRPVDGGCPASRLVPRIELLVVQPTPFCNIDCRYCYLPDRNSKAVVVKERGKRCCSAKPIVHLSTDPLVDLGRRRYLRLRSAGAPSL